MAAKFTRGDSLATTTHTRPPNKAAEPGTSSVKLRAGNTMSGMPGKIGTSATTSGAGTLRGSTSIAPNKGGPIGQKGGTSKRLDMPGKKAAGTIAKNAFGRGGAGKVESMRGRTATKAEGRKSKSLMY